MYLKNIIINEWKDDLKQGNILTHNTRLLNLFKILYNEKLEAAQNVVDNKTGISFDRKSAENANSKTLSFGPIIIEIDIQKAIGTKENRGLKKPIKIREHYNRLIKETAKELKNFLEKVQRDSPEFLNNSIFKNFKNISEGIIYQKENQNKYLKLYFENENNIKELFKNYPNKLQIFEKLDNNIKNIYTANTKGFFHEERLLKDINLNPSFTTIRIQKGENAMESIKDDLKLYFSKHRSNIVTFQSILEDRFAYFKDSYTRKIINFITKELQTAREKSSR